MGYRINTLLFTITGLLHAEQLAHLIAVGLVHQSNVVEVAFLLLRFLRQDVTVKGMLSFQFSRSGKSKSLFGTGIRLYFWHFLLSI